MMTNLSPTDRDALARALQIDGRRGDVDPTDEKKWLEAARGAAYACQCRALRLKPWQLPPSQVSDLESALRVPDNDIHGWRAAAELLQRLLAAGLSQFEPDPLRALERAEAARSPACQSH